MKQTFAALSSKGGVGKTTTLANIGVLLADMSERVRPHLRSPAAPG